MPGVAVVTDSSACLPADLLGEYGIIVVPLSFLLNGELYRDGDLSPAEFYRRLSAARGPIATNAPAPGEFIEAFRKAQERGAEAVLCLTLASEFSGTHSSAVNAARMAQTELPGLSIEVADSGALAMAHGFAVLAAARVAAAGGSLEEAAAAARDVAGRAQMVGALETMRFLARGGRVPWIVHWAASLLRIKPVLAFSGGRVRAVARARTMVRAMNRMLDYMAANLKPGEPVYAAVMQAGAPDRAEDLARRVQERFAPAQLLMTEFTSVMGIHTGPGFVGLAFCSGGLGGPQPEARRGGRFEEDLRVLERALGELPPPQSRPALVVLSGLPGTGKSHLARELCRRYPMARLESDVLRKALFPRPDYSAPESTRLFAACHALLDRLLARGVSALLDATNLKEIHRRPLYRIAENRGARLVLVEVQAPREVVESRLERRSRGENPWDQSEAGLDVYEKMRAGAEPIQRPHLTVDTSGDLEEALAIILRELQEVSG